MAPELASGQKLAAFGLTEPDAGSDAGATRTRAELRDGEWVINGSKIFITNAGTDISACVTITALTGDGRDLEHVVPNGTSGYGISAPMHKMGWHASDTRELSFRDCAVPGGQPARPAREGASSSSWRSSTAGGSRSRRWASAWHRARTTSPWPTRRSGSSSAEPIGSFQAVQFKLADMATEIECGRALVYKAAWLKDQGRPFAREAAMAKLFTGVMSGASADDALQIHGGYGYMDEFPISRLYRDQKILEIGEGTNNVQRMVIAKHLGL